MGICIFCLQYKGTAKPYCKDNPGQGCTFGFHHEFDDEEPTRAKPKQTIKAVDKQVCTVCGLHAKNPKSVSSDCAHQYPE